MRERLPIWLNSFLGNTAPLLFLPRAIRQLTTESSKERSLDKWFEFTQCFPAKGVAPGRLNEAFSIRPSQIGSEITNLLIELESVRPRAILEIGTADGGTLFLFTKIASRDAILITVDLPEWGTPRGYWKWREVPYHSFVSPGQTIQLVRGNSHSQTTLHRVKSLFRGKSVDFLFIDGDHSYSGVKQDFEMYAPLLRSGGLAVFHDIMPDHGRFKRDRTAPFSGGVPIFWNELKRVVRTLEFVDDPDQEGYGIGLAHID